MKKQHVVNCQFSSWYQSFKDVTIKSRVLPLPAEVLEYLMSDGSLVLPEGSGPSADQTNNETSSDIENSEIDWDADSSPQAEAPCLQDFDSKVRQTIRALGGSVFPKLNWSSPKDAVWISPDSTLKCRNPGDIYLLLKSSDFVTHDLTQPFDQCEDCDSADTVDIQYELVLRRWHDLNPGGEFRCFVRNNELIAISQRHHSNFFSFITGELDSIQEDIQQFYNTSVKDNFPDTKYVFDVYRKEKGKVYLLDFNPFGKVTDPLLFTWEELNGNQEGPLVSSEGVTQNAGSNTRKAAFRYVKSGIHVQPNPYGSYAMPRDFVDLSSGEDPLKFIDLLKMKVQSQNEDDSSSDSESNTNS